MKLFTGKASPVRLQWLVWCLVFTIQFFSLLPMDGWKGALVYSVISVFFYAIIIYGNISFLLPRLYKKGRIVAYILSSFLLVVLAGLAEEHVIVFVYNRFFAMHVEVVSVKNLVYFGAACVMVYLLSFVFRIAIDYFSLKKEAEAIAAEKNLAELNLLKSHVQPHFLFNTLNNIYYEAYREAPRTAALIERLSEIMRYFVDESPREEVSLATEVKFLENYIALEKIRIRYELNLVFTGDYLSETRVPPMLLMPFVENIFKHGIDKSSRENNISISLLQQEGYLFLRTENRLYESVADGPGSGIGNLRKRLGLLFGTNFELEVGPSGSSFKAFLKIPVR
ncbi:MAG TPA: histidine kinase [Chitinophagaceae bacterium]|jgi:sensor histidine kinase YesM